MTDRDILQPEVLSKFFCAFFTFADVVEDDDAAGDFIEVATRLVTDRPKGYRAALRQLLNDCFGIARPWTSEHHRQFEMVCRQEGVPTLADYATVLSRRVSRLVKEGDVRSEADADLLQAVLSDEIVPVCDDDRARIEGIVDSAEETMPEESEDDAKP
jgi:hypothetical protein